MSSRENATKLKPVKLAGRAPSLTAQAYEAIKQRILVGGFRPGACINEAKVAQEMKLSRTPVHHAFSRLNVEGFVDVLPRKGIVVRDLSLAEMAQLVPVRIVNEQLCARLAAERATPATINQLGAILGQAERATKQRATEQLVLLDREFHIVLARASGNEVLEDLLCKLHERSLRFWFLSLTSQTQRYSVQKEHAEILSALHKRDPAAAAAAVRQHVESFHSSISAVFAPEPTRRGRRASG